MFRSQVMVGSECIDVTIERETPVKEARVLSSELLFSWNLSEAQLVGVNVNRNQRTLLSEAWCGFISEVDRRFEKGAC